MISVDNIVAAQHRDIQQAQRMLSARAVATTEAALEEVDRKLWRARPGSWTEAEALATRAQLRAGIRSLALAHQQDLQVGLPPVMRAAQGRTADYLKALDQRYLGAVRPLRFDTLPWWEKHAAELGQVRLREFSASFARYGAETVFSIERAISASVVTGQRWDSARREVWRATASVVGKAQWKVDRILVTEVSAAYNGTTLAALHEEDEEGAPMLKKLVATFDMSTAADSIAVHGQVRRVGEPFRDPKGRLYQAPPNRPHDREIVVGWRASWGEGMPAYDAKTARDDTRFVPTPELPPAPPLKVSKPPSPQADPPRSRTRPGSQARYLPPEKVLLQAVLGGRQNPAPRPSPQRAYLAGLTARRLIVASQIRAALMAPKLELAVAVNPLEPLKTEYADLRIRQALAATSVRVSEGDLLPVARIRPGSWLDFGGLMFQVLSVTGSIRLRTPYGPAVLPLQPLPAAVRASRPARVLRPRSQADVAALLAVALAVRQAG